MTPRRLALPAFVLCLAGALTAAAAGAEWSKAALFGADVRSLAVAPDRPDTVFAGTSGGQVYLSHDGGRTWTEPAPEPLFPGWVVAALRFDPNQPRRLWAGMWGVWGGGMVAFSDDDGARWTWRQDGLAGQVYSLALVPGEPGKVLIGTRRGVWTSTDEGQTWRHLTAALPEMQKVTSLLVDATSSHTLFAGTWRRAYRSDDGGATWRGVFTGMDLDREVFSLTPVPERPGELWASTCGWVYRSPDRGGQWTMHRQGLTANRTPSFGILPGGRLLAGTVGGLFTSDDDGKSWLRASAENLTVLAIAVHPARPRRVLLGTEGSGVWRSEDGGATFERAAEGMTNVRVAALQAVGAELVAAVNHAGPASGLYSSIDGGRTFQLQKGGLPTVLALAASGELVWAATEKGLWQRGIDFLWQRVAEVPEVRVERVEVSAGQIVARTQRALYERKEGRFAAQQPSPLAAAEQRSGDASWQGASGASGRVVATGDRRFSHLLLDDHGDGARLWDEVGRQAHPLPLPVPARDVTSAVLVRERLILGTANDGVVVTDRSAVPALTAR
ncbi:MAG TPA: hypothetical protein VF017_20840 [Thermoanaerobaculia bacterium]|nr:hypothetical protein [Thermoanaerobaculia bacterium]